MHQKPLGRSELCSRSLTITHLFSETSCNPAIVKLITDFTIIESGLFFAAFSAQPSALVQVSKLQIRGQIPKEDGTVITRAR